MKIIRLLLACLAIMSLGAQGAELYRWVDKAGKVHYSDSPPTEAAGVEKKNLSATTSDDEELPYETQRAKEKFPVTLYVTPGCGAPCDQARNLLKRRGVPFAEKLLKTQQEIDAFYKESGSTGAPAISIGRNYLSGFQEPTWNGELDLAGYPKSASYRQRVAPPKKPAAPEAPATEGQGTPAEPAPTESAPPAPAPQ